MYVQWYCPICGVENRDDGEITCFPLCEGCGAEVTWNTIDQSILDRVYTAGELAGDWWWLAAGYGCKLLGGRVVWDEVSITAKGAVRLARLTRTLKQVNRYVQIDTPLKLVVTED